MRFPLFVCCAVGPHLLAVSVRTQEDQRRLQDADIRGRVRVWPKVDVDDLPELNEGLWGGHIFSEKQLRFSSGIAMSGGGVRAYLQTLGALRGLDKPRGPAGSTLEHIRYLAAVSGGSWGAASYTYYQMPPHHEQHFDPNVVGKELAYVMNAGTDFPPINFPRDWKQGWKDRWLMVKMDVGNNTWKFHARFPGRVNGPLKSLTSLALPSMMNGTFPAFSNLLHERADDSSWLRWVDLHILRPANIPKNSIMAASEGHAQKLRHAVNGLRRSRSKVYSHSGVADNTLPWSMKDVKVIKPRKPMPFLVFVGTALGPSSAAPASFSDAQYATMEFNPLYSGFLFDYGRTWGVESRRMNGAVETMFFGGEVKQDQATRNFSLSRKEVTMESVAPWRLSDAACISSFAPAAKMFRPADLMSKAQSYLSSGLLATAKINLFDNGAVRSEDFVLGDGGASGNVPVINLLQRKVKCVAAFWWQVSGKDIQWWKEFVSTNGEVLPRRGQIDYDLAALFGVFLSDYDTACGDDGCDLINNQVFERADLVALLDAFLQLHEQGKYLVHRMRLTTRNNAYLGVVPYEVEVIFSYASTSSDFITQVESANAILSTELVKWGVETKHWMFEWERDFNKPWVERYGHPFPLGGTMPMTMNPMDSMGQWLLYQNAGNSILANQAIYDGLNDPSGFCAS